MNNKKTDSSLQMMKQDVKLAKTAVESLKTNFDKFVERFDKLEMSTKAICLTNLDSMQQ
jgi:hypothetical protein